MLKGEQNYSWSKKDVPVKMLQALPWNHPKSYLLRSVEVSMWHKIRIAVAHYTGMLLAKLRLLNSTRDTNWWLGVNKLWEVIVIPFYFVEIKLWVLYIFIFFLIATLITGMSLFSEIWTSISDGCLQSANPAKFLILYLYLWSRSYIHPLG